MLEEKLQQYRAILPRLTAFEQQDWEENFLVEFTHDSTSIEGNTISLLGTKMILTDGIIPAETSVREYEEIQGHASAWGYVKACVKNKVPLTEDILKNIHEKVLPRPGVEGIYRSVPVYIRGASHVPPNPRKVWDEMKNFCYRLEQDPFPNPVEKAAWVHADFVRIHPFQDGNGRTARLLMNYVLLENAYPPVTIKKRTAERYFKTLDVYATTGELTPFYTLLQEKLEEGLDGFLGMYGVHLSE